MNEEGRNAGTKATILSSCFPAFLIVFETPRKRAPILAGLLLLSTCRVSLLLPANPKEPAMRRILAVSVLLFAFVPCRASDDYKLGPDSERQPNVPQGKVDKHHWTSQVFAGTERDYWIYLPVQYDAKTPACVMVFQDGGSYQNEKGQFRVPIVFDNLIHKKEM